MSSPTPIRLGAVSYLNTLPLIEGLGKLKDIALTLTAPADLIGLLLERRIDMGLVSLIDAQRATESLAFLPVGMIASDGPTLTVRMFSTKPIAEISEVAVDADSHTSVALLRLILAKRHGVRPTITPIDLSQGKQPKETPEAILLIGDKVISTARDLDRYPHQLDLGQEWKAMTGLPFVYAIWMCRESEMHEPWVTTACATLDRARRHNVSRLDWIVGARATARAWPAAQAREYLGRLLQYEVTDAHRGAVELFFDLCAQEKIIPARKPSIWADALTPCSA